MTLPYWFSLGIFLCVAALSIAVARGWRQIAHLKDMPLATAESVPRVSVIVSALNEAGTIEPALRSLLSINYPNLEVIAINDRSTDATGAILDRMGQCFPALHVVHVNALPPRWLGKNHALHLGASMASGDYLLFTDADAVFHPTAVSRAVAYSERCQVDHLTLFFDLVARSSLLQMLILSFAAGFMARFQPWKTATSPRHFVGVGGFNLVRKAAYDQVGGHAALRLAVLDDMMLGKLLKENGWRQHVLFGTDMITIEWYHSANGLVHGMEKNIYAGFDYQLGKLVAVTLLVVLFRIWPWLALLVTEGVVWWINAMTVATSMALYMDLLLARGWSLRCLVWAPAVPLIELYIWWRGSLLVLVRDGITWRGTHYPLAELRRAHAGKSGLDRKGEDR